MKNILLNTTYTLLLTSCTALNLQYKEGEQVSRMANDLKGCETTALQQVPKDIRTRYLPPVYAPYGFYGHYGYYGYGRTERYDANEGKRNDATTQCMSDQGYTEAKIPACSPEITRATKIKSTKVLPPLTENSCSIRLKSGGWQIVNPG